MGFDDPVSLDEEMERRGLSAAGAKGFRSNARICEIVVVLFASLVFLLSAISLRP